MYYDDDYEQHNSISIPIIVSIIGVAAVLALILIIVLSQNSSGTKTPAINDNSSKYNMDSPILEEEVPVGGTLKPSDLDFWDLYPEKKEDEYESVSPVTPDEIPGADDFGTVVGSDTEAADPNDDGKHTKVIQRDGSEKWVLINQYLPKNDYDYANLVCKADRMEYYTNNELSSFVGINVSKYQDYIDFNKVKKDGIDFVMVRAGARGYGTGQLLVDDYFAENIKRADDAGLDVGVYFSSQATTKEEVLEEVQLILDGIEGHKITYPIAIDMEFAANDMARIESLSKSEKTDLIKLFLDTVYSNGYTAMIYGNKEWLIQEIDLSKLGGYDVWYSDYSDLPDYPYAFSMWQYKTGASVDGISGFVDLNISFIDFAEK